MNEFQENNADLFDFDERYKMLVDSWQLYDNSDILTILIAEGQN